MKTFERPVCEVELIKIEDLIATSCDDCEGFECSTHACATDW